MKASILVLGIAVALSGSLSAQDAGIGTSASSRSSTSASARRNGVSAAHESDAAAAAAASKQMAVSGGKATEMNATLSNPIDARRAKAGDEVAATLAQDARGDGTTLPRGTRLIGHVTESRPRAHRSGSAGGGSDSRLGIVFDRAVLADGREVPLAATIQAVASHEADAASSFHGTGHGVSSSAFGARNVARAGSVGGGGLAAGLGGPAGGVAGAVGGTLGGAADAAGGLEGTARASLSSAAYASAGAVGGVGAAGQLLGGSFGVFGMPGVDLTSRAAGAGQVSVLTSHTGNVALQRGTRMLLVGQAGGVAAAGAR